MHSKPYGAPDASITVGSRRERSRGPMFAATDDGSPSCAAVKGNPIGLDNRTPPIIIEWLHEQRDTR